MPDLIAIGQGLNAIRAAAEIVKTMVGLRDSAKIIENTVKLNNEILSVQSSLMEAHKEQATLLQTIRALEEEVADLKAWETRKKKYELQAIGTGAFAYVLKKEMQSTKPIHWICTQCYDDGKRSVLQRSPYDSAIYRCNRCQHMITVSVY